jgi:hypothetical protein
MSGDSGDNEKLIEMLQIQLDRKDKQIDELNARLADTTTALVAAQQTAATAQALHAGTIKQQLIESTGDGVSADESETTVPSVHKSAQNKTKRGLFGLFKRKA